MPSEQRSELWLRSYTRQCNHGLLMVAMKPGQVNRETAVLPHWQMEPPCSGWCELTSTVDFLLWGHTYCLQPCA